MDLAAFWMLGQYGGGGSGGGGGGGGYSAIYWVVVVLVAIVVLAAAAWVITRFRSRRRAGSTHGSEAGKTDRAA
jgi:hypothetical protein